MRLPILALFSRSLRLESRQFRTYGMRLALVIFIAYALWMAYFVYTVTRGAPGLSFFAPIIYINFFFITVVGISYFSSAITEEKEEMTLGLLKMTSLNPVSILLGKSTSRLAGAILLLLVQFPFTILAVTLGGVATRQVFATYLTLAAYVFFLSNLALLCSVVCKRSRTAAYLTGLLMLGFFFCPTLWNNLAKSVFGLQQTAAPGLLTRAGDGFFNLLERASPFSRMQEIMLTGFSGPAVGFQFASNIALGVFSFLLAWAAFGFFTREEKEGGPGRGLVFKRTSRLRIFSAGRVWSRPLVWKDFNFLAGGKSVLIIKFIVLAAIVGTISYLALHFGGINRIESEWLGVAMMIVALIAFGVESAFYASRLFREEVRWRTLPSIMILPVSLRRIALHKILGILLAMIPSMSYFLLGALMAPEKFFEAAGEIVSGGAILLVISQFIFFLYLVVFLSLVLKRGALALSFVLMYVGNTIVFAVIAMAALVMGGTRSMMGGFVISALISVFICCLLHYGIVRRLRKLAGQ